jgi:hypothetical protein
MDLEGGSCGRLNKAEEFRNLYASPVIIRVIK